MPDVFIALEEAAAFESVSYKTLTQRIYRNPQQYKTKSQAREGGGKDQVLISTSSLSAKARKAWRAAQKVEGSEVIIDKRAQEAVPWYVTADLNQYTEANKKRFYEAVELAARVQDFIDYDGPDRTGYAERYALGLGISPQSLYRYMKNVLEANAWALKLEKEDGKSRDYFRALALCRKPKETGTFPSLTDEQKASLLASFTTCWSVQERRCWQMAKIDLNDYLEKLTEPEDRETVANRAYQRELFEQYVTKDGNFPEQRAQLLEDFRAGKELTGPKGLRRKLGAFDLEYFGRAYLAHYFVRPSPKFHGELDRIWREGVLKGMNPEVDAKRISRADGCRRAIEAPRGHAKSTTFTFKDDLHAAVYGYKHYIIILSDSSEQAEGFLVDIKTELEENAALKEDFGELEGKVWKSSVILLANGVKIEAIGSGKKIRGRRHKQWRPDLIVCDDLENDENVNTPEQRKKLRDWFYKAVSKAGDTYTDIVYIGTLLHFDALLANVAKNPSYKSVRYQGVISFATNGELWDAWESIFTDLSNDNRQEDALEFFQANREAMLEGTAVLWEEKLSYYDLMVIRISEGEASFNSEIQNDPIDPENCTFQEEWFDFWDDEGKVQPDFSDPKFLFIGANDPSLGKNKKSDTSSIIALAKDTQTGYLYVVIADIAKRKPDQIIEDALDASRRLQREYKRPYYKFGVETVQFQYYFAEIMRQRAAAVGEYLPIEEINSTQNKDARIQSLQPFVKNGYIKFSKKHKTLLKQMTEYPMGKNDDAPDGLQMAVKLALDVKTGRRVDYRSVIARALDFRRGAY